MVPALPGRPARSATSEPDRDVRADARPGACIFQSWGSDVPSGPLALDQPPNSFWADRSVVETMLAARDSWSLSGFVGYPPQSLPESWTYAGFA